MVPDPRFYLCDFTFDYRDYRLLCGAAAMMELPLYGAIKIVTAWNFGPRRFRGSFEFHAMGRNGGPRPPVDSQYEQQRETFDV
jgi:hypothetical protein